MQKNCLTSFEAPKPRAFKSPNISSNLFLQCNFWLLFNLLCFISFFCKILSKQGVNPKRYSWYLLFQILFLNFSSYFLSHFILFCNSSICGRCWVDWTKVVIKEFWRGIFMITTFHDIVILQIFHILQVDFVSICLQVQNFYSQQSKYMDVHEF